MVASTKQAWQRQVEELRQQHSGRLSHLDTVLRGQEELVEELQHFAKVQTPPAILLCTDEPGEESRAVWLTLHV